jgi:tyrosyl-tRNA synthetase
MHIAQGILRVINVNKLVKAGCEFIFWVADWFALMNDKMGGDLEKIQVVGRYFIEIWRAAGMDLRNVQFKWTSEEINKNPHEYWSTVIDIACKFKVDRITRCCTIMGRAEKDKLQTSQLLYPCMQCADIFYLKADICQLGLDQRKVNMLAREYCDFSGKTKPIIVSHRMLSGISDKEPVKEVKEEEETEVIILFI